MYHGAMPDDTRTAKRRWERRRVQMTVTLVIEGDEAEYLGNTVDLSPQGLCLQSEATLSLGQPVGLLLGTEPNCFIKARVVWVGKAGPEQPGQAGFEFLNILPGPAC
ncbi:MAG: PilZ domain-containing protein [Terriglobia bacterium]